MLGDFDSRKNWHSTKFERKPWIFEKLSFRELCDSKLSCLYPFDYMVIIHWVKNMSKIEKKSLSSWATNPWSNFCVPHWELISRNKWHPETSETSTLPAVAAWAPLPMWKCTRTTPVFFWVKEKPFDHYFQFCSPYYQEVQYNQETPITAFLRWKVNKKGYETTLCTATTYFYLSKPVSSYLTVKSDSVLTNLIGKDGVGGLSM